MRALAAGYPCKREVALEAVDGGIEVGAHDLAALGQVGAPEQLVDVEARAVEVDLHPVDQLSRDDARRDQDAPAVGLRRDPPAREASGAEQLAQERARAPSA